MSGAGQDGGRIPRGRGPRNGTAATAGEGGEKCGLADQAQTVGFCRRPNSHIHEKVRHWLNLMKQHLIRLSGDRR